MPRVSRGRSELRRRTPRREPKLRILILGEGGVTEARYFRDLWREHRNQLVDVEIDDRGGNDPKALVERAAARKKEAEREARSQRDDFLRYDEIWCVVDVDEHTRLADARQQARDNGVDLAVSNPCFELWALLHFQDHSAFVERKRLRGMLKRHLPGYDKALPYERLRVGYTQAVQRATDLDRRREEANDVGGNPSTGVYRLTEKIRLGGA